MLILLLLMSVGQVVALLVVVLVVMAAGLSATTPLAGLLQASNTNVMMLNMAR